MSELQLYPSISNGLLLDHTFAAGNSITRAKIGEVKEWDPNYRPWTPDPGRQAKFFLAKNKNTFEVRIFWEKFLFGFISYQNYSTRELVPLTNKKHYQITRKV